MDCAGVCACLNNIDQRLATLVTVYYYSIETGRIIIIMNSSYYNNIAQFYPSTLVEVKNPMMRDYQSLLNVKSFYL